MIKIQSCTASHGITGWFTILACQKACWIFLGDHRYRMVHGDLILARENISWSASVEESIFSIVFSEDFFDPLFYTQIAECRIIYDFMHEKDPAEEHLFFHSVNNKEAQLSLSLLADELKQNDEHHNKLLHLLVVQLVTYLDRDRPEELILPNSTMVSKNRFGKILKYMGDHYTDCTLKSIAEKFGYNPDYLSTRFQMITGETFSHKLLSVRLEQAQNLLISTDLTVEQISSSVGFKDKSYFIKKFKEVYHNTPAVYRRSRS